jgi:Bacterial SH3 domain
LMGFHRSALLSVMAVGFMTGAVLCRPAYAEEGELIAQEDKAQINVRSLANTQADIVAAGAVGDRVQILEHSVGNDALIWYRVKLLKSGETGWIRGDLIKILGSPTQKAAKNPVPQSKSSASANSKPREAVKTSAASPANPVPLTPPKPPASAKSSAPPAATAAKATVLPSSTPTASPPSNWGGTGMATPKPAPAPAPAPSAAPASALNSSTTTIVTFQTSTYAVRVFSESGQLRLNLFNRKTKSIALSAVPVQGKSSSDGTTYSYQGDVKVTVLVPAAGQPTLSAVALGETLKEQSEKEQSEASPSPAASAPAKTAPAPAAPATPAPAAPATPAPAAPTTAPIIQAPTTLIAPEAPISPAPAAAPAPQ